MAQIVQEGSRVPWRLTPRDIGFASLVVVSVLLFWAPLKTLFGYISLLRHESFSHIVLIPWVGAYLLYLDRKKIFASVENGFVAGGTLWVMALALYALAQTGVLVLDQEARLAAGIFALVTLWVGGFLFFYGRRAFRAGLFPILFLYFMVPIPEFLLDAFIKSLQRGSAEVSYAIFWAVGVPIYREGFAFSLPGLTIVVSEECSGIRSSLALLITSLIAGYLFLGSVWRRVVLTSFVVPIISVTNGIRIFGLTMLSIYVDAGFLKGDLHRRGGVLFFILALIIMAPILHFLRKSEARKSKTAGVKAEVSQSTA